MAHRRIREKVRAYNLYNQRNLFKHRYGQEYENFKVIFETVSQERINNLKESLKREMGLDLFCFADSGCFKKVSILDQPIWWDNRGAEENTLPSL